MDPVKEQTTFKMETVKEQIDKLQEEIEESSTLLNQGADERLSRQELKELIKTKRNQLAELEHKMDNTEEPKPVRHSDRISVPTETFLTYRKEEQSKREKKLFSLYSQWKIQIRSIKENLKMEVSDSELANMADVLEK